jgi:GNAT superfamily N-acetyltransferase
MAAPRLIDADGKQVLVKLMDDSWIWNECVGAHPIKPRQGVVWRPSDRCTRLPVPGDQLRYFARRMCDTYGNCAAVAWYGDTVLGHLVFLPRAVSRECRATGWESFGPPTEDDATLVVINLAFCSLSGHEFRRKGIGKALVATMLDWAREGGWRRIEVYGTGSGLFPGDWYDSCIPPRPFWERRGFSVFARHGDGRLSDEEWTAIMADNPRNSADEQSEKERIRAASIRGEAERDLVGYRYDLRRDV